MTILDTLSKDLGTLIEREMAKERFDLNSLYIALLLLIGWRRGTARHKSDTAEAESERVEESDGGDAFEDNLPLQEASNQDAFDALKAEIEAFRCANPYLRNLLFRDYQAAPASLWQVVPMKGFGRVRVHSEAILYVDEVLLLRRLQLARKIGDKPTNLHCLLESLCRFSRAAGEWAETEIRRLPSSGVRQEVDWFFGVVEALRQQRERLGDNIGATARNRRAQSGPYWLLAGACAEEVGEELALREALEIAPVPLRKGFAGDESFAKLLRAVVDALNRHYALLRGCGLLPADWLGRDDLSIDRLKELVGLRKQAVAGDDWKDGRREAAFRRAFEERLAVCKGSVVGFEDFADWLDSDVGEAMLQRGAGQEASLSGWFDDGEEDFDPPDENASGAIDFALTLEDIMEDAGPRLAANPVLNMFFAEVLVAGREFMGRDGHARDPRFLINDKDFDRLLDADPRYAGLDAAGVSAQLSASAHVLIVEVLLESAAFPIAPALREYIQWTLLEGKPVRGKNGLFERKSFKTLLAAEPKFAALEPGERAERLHRDAMALIAALLRRR
jgi:hypothetical protein